MATKDNNIYREWLATKANNIYREWLQKIITFIENGYKR